MGAQEPPSPPPLVVGGRPPSPEQQRQIVSVAEQSAQGWAIEAPVKELERVEEAAKQLVTLTGTLQTLCDFAIASASTPGGLEAAPSATCARR